MNLRPVKRCCGHFGTQQSKSSFAAWVGVGGGQEFFGQYGVALRTLQDVPLFAHGKQGQKKHRNIRALTAPLVGAGRLANGAGEFACFRCGLLGRDAKNKNHGSMGAKCR